jgi:hypothetical protein
MIQPRQGSRFALEAREPLGIGGEAVRKRFESDGSAELGVEGPIDLTHATGANDGLDFVNAKASASCEGH